RTLSPELRAGLPDCRAMVWVGPPLSASGPSLGSPVMVSASPPLPSSTRLWLPVRVPKLSTSPPVLLATMLLFNDRVPELSMPPPWPEELPERVQLVTDSVPVPLLLKMPPPTPALLPARVQSVSDSVRLFQMPPPTSALLPARVHPVSDSGPTLKMP